MPCRVGITTNPKTRKADWERKVVGLKNWRIIRKFQSRKEAQEYETKYAKKYRCKANPGGNEADGIWHVYRFEYTRMK